MSHGRNPLARATGSPLPKMTHNIIPFPSPGNPGAESQNKTGACTSDEPKGASMGVLAEHPATCESAFSATLEINGVLTPLTVSQVNKAGQT